MRMYSVTNKARTNHWICAKDEDQALEIAMKIKATHKMENLSLVDVTEFYTKENELISPKHSKSRMDSLSKILVDDKVGTLYVQVTSFSMHELQESLEKGGELPKSSSTWALNEVEV